MSKTINEIYEEVMKSDLLKQGFLAAEKTGTLKAFAEKLGCEADVEEIQTFLKGKLNEDKELSLDELEQAAGGKGEEIGPAESPVNNQVININGDNNIVINP